MAGDNAVSAGGDGVRQIRTIVPGLARRRRRSRPAATVGQDPVTSGEEADALSDDTARPVEETVTGRG